MMRKVHKTDGWGDGDGGKFSRVRAVSLFSVSTERLKAISSRIQLDGNIRGIEVLILIIIVIIILGIVSQFASEERQVTPRVIKLANYTQKLLTMIK